MEWSKILIGQRVEQANVESVVAGWWCVGELRIS